MYITSSHRIVGEYSHQLIKNNPHRIFKYQLEELFTSPELISRNLSQLVLNESKRQIASLNKKLPNQLVDSVSIKGNTVHVSVLQSPFSNQDKIDSEIVYPLESFVTPNRYNILKEVKYDKGKYFANVGITIDEDENEKYVSWSEGEKLALWMNHHKNRDYMIYIPQEFHFEKERVFAAFNRIFHNLNANFEIASEPMNIEGSPNAKNDQQFHQWVLIKNIPHQ